jgi:2-dehydro-3-deoxyphosphogluconate aldolase/(4S)-4-hydroxy-2-oxoglutarate aldolase
MLTGDVMQFLHNICVVPVLTIERIADAVPLARALVRGGLPVVEVTLRTQAGLDAAREIARHVPDCVLGIGTVLTPADVIAARTAGAKFLVSPGTTPELVTAFLAAEIPALPGCASVSEAMMLAARGFQVLKFFPAEAAGGVDFLASVAAPLPTLKFCPTGGIGPQNARRYLALPNVVAVGGSWPASKAIIAAGKFDQVTATARTAAALRGS